MNKKVLVLSGSPRKGGNSDCLADAFIRGTREAGNDAEKILICQKNVKGCLGCGACQRNGGSCIQKDDIPEIYEKLKMADAIVLASPVYFYTWTAQLKAVLDRTFAVERQLKGKTFYLLCAGQAPSEDYMATMLDSFRKYIGCFRGEGNKEGGYVIACGTDRPGDAMNTPAIGKAYEMGKQFV